MKRKWVCLIGFVVVVSVCIVVATVLILLHKENTSPPEVSVAQGLLEGQWMPVSDGPNEKKFAAFKGIPYAAPPLGPLRFKAPRPPLQWKGKRNATQESADCWQQSSTSLQAIGSEDCLYLNVYTPTLPDQGQTLLPVYFFIHGGTFLFGTANQSFFGPEFLMLQNIVVVTIKYRLNVFGFLNLDNEIVPGNAGIKDQIAALRWVRENINKFGGDPDQITVGGQSAGSVSAHWLSLLPESKDMMKKVILESGSALHSWGYNEDNFDVAADLGRLLTNMTVSKDELARLVMELPAKTIMDASIPMVIERCAALATQIPYALSPERRAPLEGGEQPLIVQSPEMYMLLENYPTPMFVGMNNREWLSGFYSYGYAANETFMEYRIATLINLLPKNIIPYRDTIMFLNITDVSSTFDWTDVTNKVDSYYFSTYDMNCHTKCKFKKYLDDIVIGVDTSRLLSLRSRNDFSTTYVYRFSLRDDYSISPPLDPEQGAVHSDELGYIWKISGLNQTVKGDTIASKTLLRMTNMWGSFIKTGIPSPDGDFELQPSGALQPRFLEIEAELSIKQANVAGPNMLFWNDLYTYYREK